MMCTQGKVGIGTLAYGATASIGTPSAVATGEQVAKPRVPGCTTQRATAWERWPPRQSSASWQRGCAGTYSRSMYVQVQIVQVTAYIVFRRQQHTCQCPASSSAFRKCAYRVHVRGAVTPHLDVSYLTWPCSQMRQTQSRIDPRMCADDTRRHEAMSATKINIPALSSSSTLTHVMSLSPCLHVSIESMHAHRIAPSE